jgi:hypothetical protein
MKYSSLFFSMYVAVIFEEKTSWRRAIRPTAVVPVTTKATHYVSALASAFAAAVGARLPRGRDAKRFHLFPVTCLGFILLNT